MNLMGVTELTAVAGVIALIVGAQFAWMLKSVASSARIESLLLSHLDDCRNRADRVERRLQRHSDSIAKHSSSLISIANKVGVTPPFDLDQGKL